MRYTTMHFRRSPISRPHASWKRPSNDEFTDPRRSIMRKFPYLDSERYGSLNYATHTRYVAPSSFNIFFFLSAFLSVFLFLSFFSSSHHRNSSRRRVIRRDGREERKEIPKGKIERHCRKANDLTKRTPNASCFDDVSVHRRRP